MNERETVDTFAMDCVPAEVRGMQPHPFMKKIYINLNYKRCISLQIELWYLHRKQKAGYHCKQIYNCYAHKFRNLVFHIICVTSLWCNVKFVTSCACLRMCAMRYLLIAGCGGQTARLLGPAGSFGIDKSQYQNNMNCTWRIEVGTAQVSNVYYCY